MILLKITIILFILSTIVYVIYKACYNQLNIVDKTLQNYPKHLYILSWLWLILMLGSIGCLIATIILW